MLCPCVSLDLLNDRPSKIVSIYSIYSSLMSHLLYQTDSWDSVMIWLCGPWAVCVCVTWQTCERTAALREASRRAVLTPLSKLDHLQWAARLFPLTSDRRQSIRSVSPARVATVSYWRTFKYFELCTTWLNYQVWNRRYSINSQKWDTHLKQCLKCGWRSL